MNNDLLQLANEAMQLENNVSKLYMIFRDTCPEDTEFWWKLVIEEGNHAALIKSGIESFMPKDLFPNEILPAELEELQEVNKELLSFLHKYEIFPHTRETAFNVALKIERSAGEAHFQTAMTKETDSKILKLFQKLNQEDKDHEKRIQAYMKEKGIKETEI